VGNCWVWRILQCNNETRSWTVPCHSSVRRRSRSNANLQSTQDSPQGLELLPSGRIVSIPRTCVAVLVWKSPAVHLRRRGGAPQTPFCIQIDRVTRGYVPLYVKGHSYGGVPSSDNSWAEAAYQSGITYYPKLLVAVPFTPATGRRILLHPEVWETFDDKEISQVRRAVASFLIQGGRVRISFRAYTSIFWPKMKLCRVVQERYRL
jgi:hypothetical protein